VHHNKQRFFENNRDLSNDDYKLEMLYAQKIIHGKLHRIRSNLTKILMVNSNFDWGLCHCCYFILLLGK